MLNERIKQFREALGLSQRKITELMRINQTTYQHQEAKSESLQLEMINFFVQNGVNAHWLLTGEGPMFRKDLKKKEEISLTPDIVRQVAEIGMEWMLEKGIQLTPERFGLLVSRVCEEVVSLGSIVEAPSIKMALSVAVKGKD